MRKLWIVEVATREPGKGKKILVLSYGVLAETATDATRLGRHEATGGLPDFEKNVLGVRAYEEPSGIVSLRSRTVRTYEEFA